MNNWEKITQDPFVLDTLGGYKIKFLKNPLQFSERTAHQVSLENKKLLKLAVDKLLNAEAIEKCSASEGQFVSPIFLVPKPDGSHRFILNLKDLNWFICKEHFKMEDLRSALNIMNEGDFMCKLDLKEAYLMVPIDPDCRKFLRFLFDGQLYQFSALPFGISPAPCVFTKLIKPILSWLRAKGLRIVAYIDDFIIFGRSREKCLEAVNLVINLLLELGLIINWGKSEIVPSKRCKFLGIIIDSEKMILELPLEKKVKIVKLVNKTLREAKIKIQSLAEVVGVLVAACPAVAYGWLYYKELESAKRKALAYHDNNMNKFTILPGQALSELEWWRDHIMSSSNKIRCSRFDLEIFSDASLSGWGAVCGHHKAKGLWDASEKLHHINYLEILAAFLALQCFANDLEGAQILLRIDNLTALAYINKMGGTRFRNLHELVKELWEWCMARNIWLFAEYVASKENPADEGSRLTNIDTEWELAPYAFNLVREKFGNPTIDLFASRVNKKCNTYCSWERDSEALLINAMTFDWSQYYWYAFPPFSLIPRILKKIIEEGSRGIIVVPYWVGQPWFPIFTELLDSEMLILSPSDSLLLSPCRNLIHPLAQKLTLVSAVLQGRRTRNKI